MSGITPEKDGQEEAESIKRLQRFSIEVWNLTQNWIVANRRAREALNELLNARLQLYYVRQSIVDEDEKETEGVAKSSLTDKEKESLRRTVVINVEKVTEAVENLEKIVGKFHIASSRVPPWRQLCPQPGPTIAHILKTLEKTLPAVVEMYSQETDIRRMGLLDLASLEHPDVFTAVSLTFEYEPFVDQDLVGCLYSIVTSQ